MRLISVCLVLVSLSACGMVGDKDFKSDCEFFNNCKCANDWYSTCSVQD